MKALDEVIGEHPFFAGLAGEYLELVAGCGQIAAYGPGEFLFQAGDEAVHFFLIRHGKVALEITAPGEAAFIAETVSEGEILGWAWLFEPHVSQFDARSITRTGVIRFDGTCLRGKCDADPALGYDLMKRFARVMVRRFTDTRLQLADLYGNQR